MEYRFYGWEGATVPAACRDYPGIETPRDLYEALLDIWCAETCAPRMRDDWTPGNPTLGQCSVTAFLAQDIFGGRVYGVPLKDGGFHCFNVVDGHVFDLTSEQFGDGKLRYEGCPEQLREIHFASVEKRQRYERLRSALRARTGDLAREAAACPCSERRSRSSNTTRRPSSRRCAGASAPAK